MQGGIAQVFASPESQSYRLSDNGPPGLCLRPAAHFGPGSPAGFATQDAYIAAGLLSAPPALFQLLLGYASVERRVYGWILGVTR